MNHACIFKTLYFEIIVDSQEVVRKKKKYAHPASSNAKILHNYGEISVSVFQLVYNIKSRKLTLIKP